MRGAGVRRSKASVPDGGRSSAPEPRVGPPDRNERWRRRTGPRSERFIFLSRRRTRDKRGPSRLADVGSPRSSVVPLLPLLPLERRAPPSEMENYQATKVSRWRPTKKTIRPVGAPVRELERRAAPISLHRRHLRRRTPPASTARASGRAGSRAALGAQEMNPNGRRGRGRAGRRAAEKAEAGRRGRARDGHGAGPFCF